MNSELNLNKLIRGFIIHSVHEPARTAHVNELLQQWPGIERIEAIYPAQQKIPFLQKIQDAALQRTGKILTHGEIGVLLTNRLIWKKILMTPVPDDFPFLILESDSLMLQPQLLQTHFYALAGTCDLFYFGGWLGHIQLFRSSRKKWAKQFWVGEPYINTLCSGYGYAVNKKAAALMLQRTKQVGYAFDEVRRYMKQDELHLGAIVSEWITQKPGESAIGNRPVFFISDKIWRMVLDIRNYFICWFK
ncbi:MAG: hypothetical protein FD136_1782 [Chitinophagaceae bacterium]|nr:MAG: hypothetical protein FD136_1782 [Chitinophagaceae bacterium]